MRRFLIPLALISALSACAKSPDVETDMHKVSFVCDRGHSLDVVFSGDHAQVMGKDFSASLKQEVSGSGIHYTGEGYDLRGKGPQMTWTSPSGETIQCRDQEWAMQQPQIQPPMASLSGTTWQLDYYRSHTAAYDKLIPPSVENYRLEFASGGALHMQLDCNRLNGQWQATPTSASEGQLTVSGGAMTRAMCQPEALDTRIATDMAQVQGYRIVGDELTLTLKDGSGDYVWKRLP